MSVEFLPLLILLILCLIMGVALVIVIQDLFKLEKKLQKSEEENQAYRDSLQKEADMVINDAHKQAMHLVEEANQKSLQIVSTSENFSEAAQKALKQDLDTVAKAEHEQISQVGDQMLQAYQATIQGVKQEGNEVITNITKGIQEQASAEMTEFINAVKKGTIESQQIIEQKINAEYEVAKKDVELYKQHEMKKAQDSIFQLVKMMTEAALGKGLTIEQHQTLVMEALEEAKAQGVIR